MSEDPHRRLAAILAADVVGYSRLMSEDEADTLDSLRHLRRNVFAPAVSEHKGTLVKSMGDGWLVEFASVTDGVRCAIQVQETLSDHERIKLRIGLHVGDVTFEDEDIYGDGVNLASRLQELADPGAVVISGAARSGIDQRLSTGFEDLGAHDLKNIPEPVTAFGWGMKEIGRDGAALPLPDKPSIAVLPFDNMSGDPEQEYFSDGLTEDIITGLSRLRWLFVIARNSTFTYKGEAVDVTRVGRELGVRYVLEGSVRKAGDRVRVTAQLIEAETGSHIWAERYDGDAADIFELQDDITTRIVGAIIPELDAAERVRALGRPAGDLGTWAVYQRAMAHVDRIDAIENAEATELLRTAIEMDPGFTPAYAHLAVLRAQAAVHGYAADQSEAFEEAREFGKLAVSQDPNDAVAHLGLGIASMFRGEGEIAIPEIETAVELNPNFARAFVWLGFAHKWCRGDTAEIEIGYYDTALRLSPRDPMRWFCLMHKGSALRVLGQHDEAVSLCQAASRFPDGGFLTLIHLATALVDAGRIEEARKVGQDLLEIRPELTVKGAAHLLRTVTPKTREPFLFGLKEAGVPVS
jgi:adenylate cyclase